MSQQKLKILVVDDDPFFIKVLTRKLGSRNYIVETAENGADALEKYHSCPDISLIISDMNMPEMNGLELIKELRRSGSDVPIIILTSNDQISVAIKAMNSGADNYLLKDGNILKAISISVEKALEKHELAVENIRLLSDLARKNKELEASNQELLRLNHLKNRFLGIAAHDLRNPLTSVRGLSEILANELFGPLTEDQKECLDIIHTASVDMLKLVNDLLDVSVIESGKLELAFRTASLRELLHKRVKVNRVIAEKKDIRIHTEFPDLPDIPLDSNRIAQVFDNLVNNAIKFSPHGSDIHISITREHNKVRVSVRDEGPGISEEDQSGLFTEFRKLSARPTGGEKCTGLGLAIVKKIVDAHHGTLEVSSQPGSGSVFSFILPTEI